MYDGSFTGTVMPMNETYPLLTTEFPGVGGVIKTRPEDFVVEELPLYEASGSGTHTYVFIENKGVSTREALDRVARALGFARRDIGSAGLKDAQAVARQWISLEHVPPERFESLDIPDVRILNVTRHTNKLKPGHLAGNRFVIRVRKTLLPPEQAVRTAEQVMAVLARRGVPNYFGVQRFGNLQINHLLGRAVIRDNAREFLDLFLGTTQGASDASQARALYDQGLYQEALDAWPRPCREQRSVLKMLLRDPGKPNHAFRAVDKHLRGLFISAYQSWLFNRVLGARMPGIDQLLAGDMAYKHVNGACFHVQDPAVEQGRCDRFEISPTGPLFGANMSRLSGPAGDVENPILEGEGLREDEFACMKRLGFRGSRRALRFQPRHAQVAAGQDEIGDYLEFQFELDAGCYATTLLTEVIKGSDAPESLAEEGTAPV